MIFGLLSVAAGFILAIAFCIVCDAASRWGSE